MLLGVSGRRAQAAELALDALRLALQLPILALHCGQFLLAETDL